MSYEIIFFIFLFIIGTLFGSFLNVVSDRTVKGESIWLGRSRCDFCQKKLGVKNLFPILSYIFQRGRCSNCRARLSVFYPVSELITGLSFVLAGIYSQVFLSPQILNILMFVYLVSSFSFLIVIFLTDAKYQIIPDKIVFPAIIITLLLIASIFIFDLKAMYDQLKASPFGPYLLEAGLFDQSVRNAIKSFLFLTGSALVISLFFSVLILVTKGRGMGGGDVKLGFLIGLFNGIPGNFLAIFLGFLIGAIYSIILIIMRKKKIRDTIAFGPFLILGSIISFLWGGYILDFYTRLF